MNVSYGNKAYIGWTEAELLSAGIPQEAIDAAHRLGMKAPADKFRRALLAEGLLDDMNAWAESDATADQRLEWEYRPIVYRNSALIQSAGVGLSLSDTDMDALFIAALAL